MAARGLQRFDEAAHTFRGVVAKDDEAERRPCPVGMDDRNRRADREDDPGCGGNGSKHELPYDRGSHGGYLTRDGAGGPTGDGSHGVAWGCGGWTWAGRAWLA